MVLTICAHCSLISLRDFSFCFPPKSTMAYYAAPLSGVRLSGPTRNAATLDELAVGCTGRPISATAELPSILDQVLFISFYLFV